MSLTPVQTPIIPRLKKEKIVSLIKTGKRIDGRRLDEYRPITIQLNPIQKAEGSAAVKIGDTMAMVGVKLEVGIPYSDRPNEGVLQVHAEFVPLASPTFEPGPPDENAIETARVIDRSLREPRAIRLEDLAIIPGQKVWIVFNDIYLLDHGGNIIDASMLASMLALNVTKMPKIVSIEGDKVVIDKDSREQKLPLNLNVVTVTIGKVDKYFIVDPNLEEESVLDAKITVAVDSLGRIVGLQKMGMEGFTEDEVGYVIELALKKAKELHSLLEKVLKNPEEASKSIV